MELVYTKNYRIEPSDVDFRKRLKPSALFDFFQDIADEAADALGFGIETLMQNYNAAWILSRIRANIARMPELYETLVIETWPSRHGRLSFERDFIVRDATGTIAVAAVSFWVVLDIGSRELRRADFIGYDLPEPAHGRALEDKPGKLKPAENAEAVYHRTIGYSDIDFNGHINNARYVDFAMDCFGMDVHRVSDVRSLEINYLSEALPGDVLRFCRGINPEEDSIYHIEGLSDLSGKTIFRARVAFGQPNHG